MRSPKNVVDEIEYLQKRFGAHQFTFYDDAFTVDQDRATEICKEIMRRKLKIEWDCETRVDMVTEDLLRTMKEAGCFAVWFGVESGSQKVLNALKKKITVEQIKNAFRLCRKYGIRPYASIMVGNPEEEAEDILRTASLLKEIKPVYVSVGHKVSLERAIKIVMECKGKYRIPEPIRRAHILAGEEKRRLEQSIR